MAALQLDSGLGRPRLARKPLGQPSTTNASSNSNILHSNLGHHHPASTISSSTSYSLSSIDIPTAGNLSLFLTSLRLLDLDLLEDWPDITPQTFVSSAKDAAGQGQKRRVQCVEWALYHMFCIWDPDEARNKLHPYFPPLDQVQSLNLRAALLRCLEHAKKMGVLGRDAVVRKTMLDECKGERLEEVLAAFSSAVLKKVVAENAQSDRYPALAQTIALEHRGFSADRTELHALILAHKASLNKLLNRKAYVKDRYTDFAQLLDAKEKTIARRKAEIHALKSQEGNKISDEEKIEIWRTLRNNWSGHERWMETLLYGDVGAKRDAVLAASFDRVWRRAQGGRVSELEDNSVGLLGQLDARVKAQRERLGRWEKFRERLLARSSAAEKEDSKGTQSQQRQRGIDLGFGSHENIRPGRMSPKKPSGSIQSRQLTGEYAKILDSLKTELADTTNTRGLGLLSLLASEKYQQIASEMETGVEEEALSGLSEIEEEAMPPPPKPKTVREPLVAEMDQPRPERFTRRSKAISASQEERQARRSQRSYTLQSGGEGRTGSDARRPASAAESVSRHAPSITYKPASRAPTFSTENISRPRSERSASTPTPPPVPEQSEALPEQAQQRSIQEPSSPTQAMADEILASVSSTSPSPTKRSSRHTLSLEERTRLSMARGTRGTGEGVRLSISPAKPSSATQVSAMDEDPDGLVARTRQSMAGFEAARQKAQLDRRRSQRKSRRPQRSPDRRETVTRFLDEMEEEMAEEEQKSIEQEGARAAASASVSALASADALAPEDTTLLAEELIEAGQADYEAVFMSRPKIKTSPLPSPVRGGGKYGEKDGSGDHQG
ncbi:hypothetical protein MKZ38_004931 [Zalerion maritima]|uniref:HAUS augmin-like complex subunit 6 N-terminal domain-containing protein n=1 Tax=Zalerion maritima TaxID=339359 RepID=A0AAD5RKR1_9PEZI|nr:hypothetical protein MKZ38_004931 [Zalerion maritima]